MKAVASMVTAGYTLCDVGTDHGYVPIALVQGNIIPKAIAVDINKGPLERANEHIRANGLTEQITTRLSNGLEAIHDGEVYCHSRNGRRACYSHFNRRGDGVQVGKGADSATTVGSEQSP